ncbi:MAG: EF-hand domain-containing protein [Aquabacterium sp.]|jgi:hypothetical protein|nr:MAG: EF-hand domain-containing protein [Aquabacterium sp.]
MAAHIFLRLAATTAVTLALASMAEAPAHAETPDAMPPTGAGKPGTNRVLEVFNKADIDHDGRLSRDEAKALPAIDEQFAKLDRDSDGFLSADEFLLAFRAEARTGSTYPG